MHKAHAKHAGQPTKGPHHHPSHAAEVKGGEHSHPDHHHKAIKHHMAELHKMAKHGHKHNKAK